MAKKNRSESDKAQANTYSGRYERNRVRKLEAHLRKQPNDEQAQQALKNITYRRKKPSNQGGWVAKQLRETPLFKGVTGRSSLKNAAWVQSIIKRGEAYGRAQAYEQKTVGNQKKVA